MTKDQLGGIFRTVLTAILTWLAAKGFFGTQMVAELAAAGSTLLVAIWSMWTNRPANIAPK